MSNSSRSFFFPPFLNSSHLFHVHFVLKNRDKITEMFLDSVKFKHTYAHALTLFQFCVFCLIAGNKTVKGFKAYECSTWRKL